MVVEEGKKAALMSSYKTMGRVMDACTFPPAVVWYQLVLCPYIHAFSATSPAHIPKNRTPRLRNKRRRCRVSNTIRPIENNILSRTALIICS